MLFSLPNKQPGFRGVQRKELKTHKEVGIKAEMTLAAIDLNRLQLALSWTESPKINSRPSFFVNNFAQQRQRPL